MKIKLLLLFLIYIEEAFGALTGANIKEYKTLAKGNKAIVEKVVPNVALILNIVSVSNNHESNDFRDYLMKLLMENIKLIFRQQDIDKIKITSVRGPKQFSFIIIRNFSDFKIFQNNLNSNIFHYNGYFIFSLINRRIDEIPKIFDELWKLQIYNLILIYKDSHEHISIVTFFPFRSSTDCSNTSAVIINEYFNESFTQDIENFFPNKLRNLQQCEIRVAVSDYKPPYIYRKTMPDGTKKFFGRDYELIKTLAEALNFKLTLNPMLRNSCVYEIQGIGGGLKRISENQSEMALTHCGLKIDRLEKYGSSFPYTTDWFIMAFPIIEDLTSFEKLFYPLTITTWMLLVAYILIGYLSIFIIKRQSKDIQNFVIGENVNYPYFNMLIAIVGLSQNRLPMVNFARFLLMNFLILCLVIRTAYQGKLFEVMKASVKHSEPKTIAEMLEDGFTFYAVETHTEFVKDSGKFTIM